MSKATISRLAPTPKPATTSPADPKPVPLTDLTFTCTDTDGHHYGQKGPHTIAGADVARLLAWLEGYAPGWVTLFDSDEALPQLRSTLSVLEIALLDDNVGLDRTELYDFVHVLHLLRAQIAASEEFLSAAELASRYVVALPSTTEGAR